LTAFTKMEGTVTPVLLYESEGGQSQPNIIAIGDTSMATPHRVIGGVADSLASGVRGVGNSLSNTIQGFGGQIMGVLDKPFNMVTQKEGPHRIVDRLLNGSVSAAKNAVDNGVMGSLQSEGEAIMHAMDQPSEVIGVPPDLGSLKMFSKK